MPHTLLLAEPRGFCAGVVRAIDVLDRVLDVEPPPVYAFHEIVHNRYVVDRFRERGAVFVDALDEVPEGARIVFSAHGVSPVVVQEAERRKLRVIDATCPLVTKVHLETKKAAKDGCDVLLVGHRGHDEIVGTAGEAPQRTVVVETPDEVAALPRRDRPVFVVTQTTLSVDDTANTIDAIRGRYADVQVRNDICYATTNRQNGGARDRRALQRGRGRRLTELQQYGAAPRSRREHGHAPAYRVDGLDEIDPAWYEGVGVVGLTAGASVPDELLEPIIDDLRERGVTTVEPVIVAEETIEFRPPDESEPAR